MKSIQINKYLVDYPHFVNNLKKSFFVGEHISLEYNLLNIQKILYKGLIIGKKGKNYVKNITLRYSISQILVDHTFPIYSPNILEIVKYHKIKKRKSKLYYFQNLDKTICT